MPGGANLYQYAYNKPVMYTDPSGYGFLLTALIVTAVVAVFALELEYGFIQQGVEALLIRLLQY